jgi:hypothetical protein
MPIERDSGCPYAALYKLAGVKRTVMMMMMMMKMMMMTRPEPGHRSSGTYSGHQPEPRNPDLLRLSVMMMVRVESSTNSTVTAIGINNGNEDGSVVSFTFANMEDCGHIQTSTRTKTRKHLLLFVSVAQVTWMKESLKSSLIKHSLNL